MTELMDELLRFGLKFGAFFQLICIAAVVWLPMRESDPSRESLETGISSDDETSLLEASGTSFKSALTGKRSRNDRKKRR